MKTDVLVVGSLNFDILVKQARLPLIGETFTGEGLLQMPGGKGGNQAVQCARLGLKVNMVGCVGDDLFGTELLNSLKENQVSCIDIKRQGASGLGLVQILQSGDYCSTIIKGANYALAVEDIKDAFFVDAPLVILQSEIAPDVVALTIEKARQFGCTLLLNNAPARDIERALLNQIDYLVVNETEASFMLGYTVETPQQALKAAHALRSEVRKAVIVTLGEKGSVVVADDENGHFPAVKCAAVVDTTGAGDSYIGALAYGIIKRLPLADSIAFASQVSAFSVQNYGGQGSFPYINDLQPCVA
ncbi:ribokinase [Rouxiella chamberiensis]|uniref:Ribokinase n=1 Tax=Rouxiella chamberiensis TaxID=1513468 RepID=A0ABY7HQU6_9GAMM|nr:ribokinase [Rouxiella chamberiensis]WAT01753.1 ribokinase [Rouxiella chamberiensis]